MFVVSSAHIPANELNVCFEGPGHFLEVEKMLPLLTSSSAEYPSFHVVAPSLPGFGFSEYTTKGGFGLAQYAEVR
jgi:hypothetical protein